MILPVQHQLARLQTLWKGRTAPAAISVPWRAGAKLKRAGLSPLLDGRNGEIKEYSMSPIATREPGRLVGIETENWGRFGNKLYANINALSAAIHLRLKHVIFCGEDGFLPDKTLTYKGVTIYSKRSLLNVDGWLLRGPFWNPIGGWPEVKRAEQRRIAREIILQCLQPPSEPPPIPADELVIHMRGGDVFTGDEICELYTQPPLAFYKKAVAKAMAEGGVTRVRIVTEDRHNPCLTALEDHLRAAAIPFSVQTKSMVDDFATLMAAEHLALGTGTFGPAACLLSDRTKSLYSYFVDPGYPGQCPWVAHQHVFIDRQGGYIKRGEWRNEDGQRQQMLDYPEEAIVEGTREDCRAIEKGWAL